jgi:hypothetical protein
MFLEFKINSCWQLQLFIVHRVAQDYIDYSVFNFDFQLSLTHILTYFRFCPVLFLKNWLFCFSLFFYFARAAAVAVAQVQQMNKHREIKEHANFFSDNIESPSLKKKLQISNSLSYSQTNK